MVVLRVLLALLLLSSPAFAQDAYQKASGAFSAATGAMILGSIETEGRSLGVGTGNIGGHAGVGIKFSLPLSESTALTVGTFRIEDGVSGSVISLQFKF